MVILTFDMGGLPWISLALAASFAIYGFLRKTLPIGPSQGFFLEVLILAVPALLYVLWLAASGAGHFCRASRPTCSCCLPAARRRPSRCCSTASAPSCWLSTIGIMQYIAPTMIFLIAVFVFHEPFSTGKAIAFGLIWTALAIYSWSMFSGRATAKA